MPVPDANRCSRLRRREALRNRKERAGDGVEACEGLDPQKSDARRHVRRVLCAVGAVGLLFYLVISLAVVLAGAPATARPDRRFGFTVVGLLGLVPFGRIAELRPVGFFAICGILILPALFALVQAIGLWFESPVMTERQAQGLAARLADALCAGGPDPSVIAARIRGGARTETIRLSFLRPGAQFSFSVAFFSTSCGSDRPTPNRFSR
jgi:hypothetical protein